VATSALVYLLLIRKPDQALQKKFSAFSPSVCKPKPNQTALQHGADQGHLERTANIFASQALDRVASAKIHPMFFLHNFPRTFGFASLSHISTPRWSSPSIANCCGHGKERALVYRRAFARHKYVRRRARDCGHYHVHGLWRGWGRPQEAQQPRVRETPTCGINFLGMMYLLINPDLGRSEDSTQDEVFSRYKVSGQQMRLWIQPSAQS